MCPLNQSPLRADVSVCNNQITDELAFSGSLIYWIDKMREKGSSKEKIFNSPAEGNWDDGDFAEYYVIPDVVVGDDARAAVR